MNKDSNGKKKKNTKDEKENVVKEKRKSQSRPA